MKSDDAGVDPIALKQRLERFQLGAPLTGDREAASLGGSAAGAFFRLKVKPLLKRVFRLSPSYRRLGVVEERIGVLWDEVANLQRSVISVVENDLAINQKRNLERAALREDIASLTRAVGQIEPRTLALDGERHAVRDKLEAIDSLLLVERLTRQKALTDFDRRLTRPAAQNALDLPTPPATSEPSPSASVQSLLETFYFLLQERYRGAREEIKQRLLVYRNDFRAARDRTGVAGPIIEIGCGRGELLEVLQEDGFRAIGVDSNDTQLELARGHGAAVVHAEAFAYLRTLEDASVLAIAGIHIVEHVPFPQLMALMQEIARVLKRGGVAVFETPNPRNLIVGATTFHFDPTHVRPLPAEVLCLVLETVGFDDVEQRLLHPSPTLEHMVKHHNLDPHIATLLFGPQDYAVIGVMR